MRTIWSVVVAMLVVIGAGVGIEAGVRGSGGPTAGVNAQPGTVAGPGSLTAQQVGAQLAAALAEWSRFPVDASPRPFVLIGPAVEVPGGGFTSGNAKIAFIDGAIDPPAQFPPAVATLDGLPLISAATAFRELIPSTAPTGPKATTRLTVEHVQLARWPFFTDRDDGQLPAWLFWLDGARGAVIVFAVSPSRIYNPPSAGNLSAPNISGAVIEQDGRHLALVFAGSPAGNGPCDADYTVSFASSEKALAVDVVAHPHQTKGARVPCPAEAVVRTVHLVLPTPLGNRVLVDAASGTAIAVRVSGVAVPL